MKSQASELCTKVAETAKLDALLPSTLDRAFRDELDAPRGTAS